MDLLLLLVRVFISQSKQGTREDFKLARSVRQGCSLVPYLFILATDVLGHMMDDPKHEIKGLHLSKGGCVWDQTFMDDTALYLRAPLAT